MTQYSRTGRRNLPLLLPETYAMMSAFTPKAGMSQLSYQASFLTKI